MDSREYDIRRRKRIEYIVVFIATIYAVSVSLISYGRMDYYVQLMIEASIIVMWMLTITGTGSYIFRATLATTLSEFSIMLYCVFVDSSLEALIPVIGFIIIVGLYELPRLVFISTAFCTIIIAHHIFISHTFRFDTRENILRSVLEIMAGYIVTFVVNFFLKEQARSKVVLFDTIDELKLAQRSKDDFLAAVSHELRTPINAICGMSEIGLAEAKSEVARENLEDIRNAGRNLLSTVSDILDYAQLSSGKLSLQEETYNISSTINDVINMSIGKIGEKKISLIVNCDPELPSLLLGDEPKIKRVMTNLVENSIKYTISGYVIMDISKREEEYGINLVVKIRDTGVGMRPESLGRIFGDFTQLSSGRNRREGGLGLGLTISRTIIEMMGGFMTVKSQYGKGTEIQFTVPQRVEDANPIGAIDTRLHSVKTESVGTDEYGEGAIRVTGRTGRVDNPGRMIMPDAHVLVVDDSFMNIKVLEGLLKPYRLKVTTAGSGKEALEKIADRCYDFVFMDHMMPEMDGVECVRLIRARENEYYKTVPIVALTANAVEGAREMFMSQGFNDFMSKPVEVSALERVLKKYVSKDKIRYTGEEEEDTSDQNTAEGLPAIGDLDVKKGLLYCGTVENYRNVLKVHATNGPDNIDKIRQFFEQKDFENYTIYIHALKSSMASIGADTLSEMSKDMEKAGKNGDIDYIEAHHEELMAEYERVVALLLGQDAMQMELSDEFMETDHEPISDEMFDEYINSFEEAAYTFEPNNMYEILDKLKAYSYNGHPLSPQLLVIRHKVEMEDYMSAVDTLADMRKRYRNR